VRITTLDRRTGKRAAFNAAYCIVTIPLKVLSAIEADFAPPTRAAIRAVDYADAVKIAWQSRRFWEMDDQIYGGISWVKGPTAMVWYPSDRFFAQKGILLGGYAVRDDAPALAARPLAEQLAASRAAVEGLHPGRGHELDKGLSIAWSKVPYSLGITPRYRADQEADYMLLNEPDGPFYFAGEHLSHVGAWQEGAILSARRAVNMIDRHRRERHA
jgi:monoamine oxidase